MTKLFQMKKIINYKVSQPFEIYNFYFDGFLNDVIWKAQKIQFQIISAGDFLNKLCVEIWFLVVVP